MAPVHGSSVLTVSGVGPVASTTSRSGSGSDTVRR